MAKQYDHISEDIRLFIDKQKIYFMGTGASTGTINVSPKGSDTFRVINSKKIIWLNLTGSGNETAAHLLQNNRMTIMFCSFDKKPLILRLYGRATSYHSKDEEYASYIHNFHHFVGARKIIEVNIDMVQTSCGFAVPFMDFKGERNTLTQWSNDKGREKIKDYWKEKNVKSIDGSKTDILKE